MVVSYGNLAMSVNLWFDSPNSMAVVQISESVKGDASERGRTECELVGKPVQFLPQTSNR
jgi:hypothetical protein